MIRFYFYTILTIALTHFLFLFEVELLVFVKDIEPANPGEHPKAEGNPESPGRIVLTVVFLLFVFHGAAIFAFDGADVNCLPDIYQSFLSLLQWPPSPIGI